MDFNTDTQGLNAKANAGLTTGIIGSALGAINTLGNAGGLAGLLGLNTPAPAPANIPGTFPGYIPTMQVDPCVNRYELGLQQQLAQKDSLIALRDANTYVDQKLLQLYQYMDGRNREQEAINTQQAVLNQANKDSFQMVSERLACVKNELEGQIKAEKAARCCADNAIVNYVNATFYPKLVADVTAGTTTTAQILYNPLPACECACGNN
jgi:hypothetical protein